MQSDAVGNSGEGQERMRLGPPLVTAVVVSHPTRHSAAKHAHGNTSIDVHTVEGAAHIRKHNHKMLTSR